MTLTIAPQDEACQAVVDSINTGSYSIRPIVSYSFQLNEDLTDESSLLVDVVHESMEQLIETLGDDPTTHQLTVWFRKKLTSQFDASEVASLNLTVAQIVNQLAGTSQQGANWSRVRVMRFDDSTQERPNKELLKQLRLYSSSVSLTVEVLPP